MNNINQKQNETKELELLFVQRALYSSAKRYFILRTIFALILAIAGPILSISNETLGLYVGIISIVYLLLNYLCLEKLEDTKRENASKIQEEFDVYVLSLPWNQVVVGQHPDIEIIASVLPRNKKIDSSSLKNWYADVSEVPLDLGRFLCQRANTWWDTTLRYRYIFVLFIFLILVCISLTIIGINFNLTLATFIVGVFLPVLPLFELLIKQIKDNYECHSCIIGLKDKIDDSINTLVDGKEVRDSENQARVFQDEIFRHRRKCPMVFDWVYWLFKDSQENQIQFSAKAKVDSYLSKKKV